MEIEKALEDKDLIVSSTNKEGIICYVNSKFCDISEYSKHELYGKNHNIIRHPDMPKTFFKYVWNNLLSFKPVVGYVKNYVKGNKKYYWVKAVMYPKVENNEITIITSYRTKATDFEITQIEKIYKILIEYEKMHTIEQSLKFFVEFLQQNNLTYDKMINRLNDNHQILNKALLNLDITKFKIDHMIFRSRIESLVEKGYENIDVVKPTCCDFGKKLSELENESFTKDPKFSEITKLHNRVHSELQAYVDANESEKESHMNDVYKDIDKLFTIMEELKNDHKHEVEL